MKTDLATSIGVAIVGALVAFFVCNLFVGEIEDVSFQTIDLSVSADLAEPNIEVFNYKALNPTVEVYVGQCSEFDGYGNCLDGTIIEDNFEIEEDSSNDESLPSDEASSSDETIVEEEVLP